VWAGEVEVHGCVLDVCGGVKKLIILVIETKVRDRQFVQARDFKVVYIGILQQQQQWITGRGFVSKRGSRREIGSLCD